MMTESIWFSSSAQILRSGTGVLHDSGLDEHKEDAQEVASDGGVQRVCTSAILRAQTHDLMIYNSHKTSKPISSNGILS